MHPKFAEYLRTLDASFRRLMACVPLSVEALPPSVRGPGIYLFSEGGTHLYVGRANDIRTRIQQHSRPRSKHNAAVFAFRLARETTGNRQASYSTVNSRSSLENNPAFAREFTSQKARVRQMHVRFVKEEVPVRQALLEVYVAVALRTPYNDFDNH